MTLPASGNPDGSTGPKRLATAHAAYAVVVALTIIVLVVEIVVTTGSRVVEVVVVIVVEYDSVVDISAGTTVEVLVEVVLIVRVIIPWTRVDVKVGAAYT